MLLFAGQLAYCIALLTVLITLIIMEAFLDVRRADRARHCTQDEAGC